MIAKAIFAFMVLMERGTIAVKLFVSACTAIIISPICYVIIAFKRLFAPDTDFVYILFVFIVIDLIVGVMKHLKQRTFSFKQLFTGLLEKMAISMLAMFLFSGLTSIRDFQQHPDIQSALLLIGKIMNALYVGGSAFNNMYVITKGQFPPVGWMRRMKNFNESIDIEDLTKIIDKKDETTNS